MFFEIKTLITDKLLYFNKIKICFRCALVRNPDRTPSGMAHIDFESEEDAAIALEYDKMPLDGREMRIILIR